MRDARMTAQAEAASPYSRTLRRLHLAIACFVVALAITGFSIYFRKPLGLQHLKMTLVFIHAVIAYAFLAVLAVRIYLGFRGADAVRLSRTLPRRQDFSKLFSGRFALAGRSPWSRMIAGVLFLVFLSNAATGLVRAGTDLYFPPFGPFVRDYVAADGVDPALVRPADRANTDAARYRQVSRGKLPFGKIHIYGAFVITGVALFHSIGVAVTEWNAPNNPRARGRARLMLFGPRRA